MQANNVGNERLGCSAAKKDLEVTADQKQNKSTR